MHVRSPNLRLLHRACPERHQRAQNTQPPLPGGSGLRHKFARMGCQAQVQASVSTQAQCLRIDRPQKVPGDLHVRGWPVEEAPIRESTPYLQGPGKPFFAHSSSANDPHISGAHSNPWVRRRAVRGGQSSLCAAANVGVEVGGPPGVRLRVPPRAVTSAGTCCNITPA